MRQPRRQDPKGRQRHSAERFEAGREATDPRAPSPGLQASSRGHTFVFYGLAAVLLAISLWCFLILGRTESLRSELARHMDWLEQAGALREAVTLSSITLPDDPLPDEDVTDGSGASHLTADRVERLAAATRRLVPGHAAPALDIAAERLEQRLEELATVIELEALNEAAYGDVAEAAYAAVTVLPGLETQVQEHVVDLYSGLDRLWTSLRTLVLVCLALCASNLGLLFLVHRRREQLETAHARAVSLASHDALTGVWNRGAILRILRLELSRAERSGRPVGVILLDLDDFRKLNVLLGSREADHVLQETSRRLATFVRPYDTLGRLGGDSFLVILPSCDATATTGVADRLRDAIEGEEVEHAHGTVQVRATLVHETVSHDPEAEELDSVDADILVHGLQLRIEEARNP